MQQEFYQNMGQAGEYRHVLSNVKKVYPTGRIFVLQSKNGLNFLSRIKNTDEHIPQSHVKNEIHISEDLWNKIMIEDDSDAKKFSIVPQIVGDYSAMSDKELINNVTKSEVLELFVQSSFSEHHLRKNPKFSELLDRYREKGKYRVLASRKNSEIRKGCSLENSFEIFAK